MAEANPFAEFDHLRWSPDDGAVVTDSGRLYITPPSNAPKTDAEGENPFARYDSLRGENPSPRAPTLRSIATQVPTGFNEATADVLGMPVDAMTWALNRIPGVKIEHPFGGSESIKHGMAAVGVPNPDDVPPQNAAERIARGTGAGIASMVVPEAAVSTLVRSGAVAPRVAEVLGDTFGNSRGAGDVAKTATVGGTSGAAGESAAELSPEQYKPAARVVGSVAGGVGGALAAETPGPVVQGARGVRDYAAPMTREGQEFTAGKILSDRASNPADVVERVDTEPGDLVPGSKPTTFQQTGDMGLGSLEREVATRNPADFQQRRADQNAARLAVLPSSAGNPADLSSGLRRQLTELDDATNAAIERATGDARTQAEAIGGQTPPEQRGAAVRGVLQDAEDAARRHEGALWRAVDPDGRLAISMGPVKAASEKVYGNLTAAAEAGLAPAERTVLQVVDGYKPVEPFKELTDLRSAVSSAMRSELASAGRSPAYGRLSALRGGIEDAIGSAVEHQVAQEAQAVARGEMSPEATAAARLIALRDAWYEQRNAANANLGQSATGHAGSDVAVGPRGVSAVPRSEGQARGRLRYDEGNPSVPADGHLQPNFDEAARNRLDAATAATRERAQTFNQGPVGQTLRTQGQRGNYRLMDAGVPDAVFKAGPKGFETVNAFRRAVGDEPAAVGMLEDMAAGSLRQYAIGPDVVLNPQRYASWLQKYEHALRALPGDLGARFGDAAAATEAIEHVATIRREALETYQLGALAKVVGAQHPDDVTKAVGSIFTGRNPVGEMRTVALEAEKDPAAKQGLRRAVVDYITGRFISNTEAAASGNLVLRADQFQEFVKQHGGALRQVLTAPEFNMLKAVAADLRRSNRSLNAVKIPGQSNTAQDALPELRRAMRPGSGSLLTQLVLAGGGGYGAGGLKGAATGVIGVLGKNVIGRMHEAGMAKVDDLIKEALLDPQLARYLLSRAPEKVGTGPTMSLGHRLRRLSMYSATQALPANAGATP